MVTGPASLLAVGVAAHEGEWCWAQGMAVEMGGGGDTEGFEQSSSEGRVGRSRIVVGRGWW